MRYIRQRNGLDLAEASDHVLAILNSLDFENYMGLGISTCGMIELDGETRSIFDTHPTKRGRTTLKFFGKPVVELLESSRTGLESFQIDLTPPLEDYSHFGFEPGLYEVKEISPAQRLAVRFDIRKKDDKFTFAIESRGYSLRHDREIFDDNGLNLRDAIGCSKMYHQVLTEKLENTLPFGNPDDRREFKSRNFKHLYGI
jgi:hypothetical protein